MKERLLGGLYGALVGDACGVPYEFKSPVAIPQWNQIDMIPPIGFKRSWDMIQPGTYSDDGAQVLCLLEVLLTQPTFDDLVFTDTLQRWLRTGYMSVDNLTFDVGSQTNTALTHGNIHNLDEPKFNGNGSLMRTLPVALVADNVTDVCEISWSHSGVTHPHMRSRLCCMIYSLTAFYMLRNEDTDAAISKAFDTVSEYRSDNDYQEEVKLIKDYEYYTCTGTGYVVDSLWSSFNALNESTFEDVIKRAISLGNDTDTTACIAGGLAGIKFGISAIPERWLTKLRGKTNIEPLATLLLSKRGLG